MAVAQEIRWPAPRVGHFVTLARIAERGKFDSFFLADSTGVDERRGSPSLAVTEPLTLLTVLAVTTQHIGLTATASMSYNSPYTCARLFSSLDTHLSAGPGRLERSHHRHTRGGTLLRVDDLLPRAERYECAGEFMDVTPKLWDSWEDDVVVADKESWVWGEKRKVHPAAHRGRARNLNLAIRGWSAEHGFGELAFSFVGESTGVGVEPGPRFWPEHNSCTCRLRRSSSPDLRANRARGLSPRTRAKFGSSTPGIARAVSICRRPSCK